MEVSCIMGPPVTTEQTLSSEKIVESCRKSTSSETFLLFSRSEHINLTLPRHGFQTGPAITHVKWCFDPSAGPCSRYHTLVLCCCQTAHFSESQNSWENVLLDQKPVCLTSFYCEIKRPLIWKYILSLQLSVQWLPRCQVDRVFTLNTSSFWCYNKPGTPTRTWIQILNCS